MTVRHMERIWLRVALCDSVQPKTWHALVRECELANVDFAEFLALPELERQRTFRTADAFERALLQHPEESPRLDRIQAELEEKAIQVVSSGDRRYPVAIKQQLGINAPPVLLMWGELGLCARLSLGMVGRQHPSERGAWTARAYARALAEEEVVVVSGNARGIDSCSHLGALEGGGATILLLPMGILTWRASTEFRQLMSRENTLIVSAWPPDKSWNKRYALARNDSIVALSDGLFAVETGLKGGTAYSVREALRTRKPLWTLDYASGEVPESAAGNHSLLGSGATPLPPLEDGDAINLGPLVARLQESYNQRQADVPWPPREHPEQGELFD